MRKWQKGIAPAAFESTLRKDASRAPTLNIFCCPVIVSLNREHEQDRLTPSAPPPLLIEDPWPLAWQQSYMGPPAYDAPASHYEI